VYAYVMALGRGGGVAGAKHALPLSVLLEGFTVEEYCLMSAIYALGSGRGTAAHGNT